MPLEFDNRVSWMDIITVIGAAATALFIFFGVSEEVQLNTVEIAHLKSNVSRVEFQAGEANRKILDELKEQNTEVKAIRQESAAERTKIIQKLDRLIERELPPRRGSD